MLVIEYYSTIMKKLKILNLEEKSNKNRLKNPRCIDLEEWGEERFTFQDFVFYHHLKMLLLST